MRVFALLVLGWTAFAASSNWPQFRGVEASGVGTGTPPTEWNGESGKNILWKAEIPGLAHSSPVIWGDRIFVTTSVPESGTAALKVGLYGDIQPVKNEPPQTYKVMCLDRKSGKVLWEKAAFTGKPQVMRHPKGSHAASSPATDGKHVIAFFGTEGLYAYDMKGKLLWKKDFGLLDSGFFMVPAAQWGFASSPIIHDKMVIVQADVQKNSFLAAFDITNGKELWRTPRADVPTWSSPAVVPYTAGGAKGMQVVVNGWKHMGGYDLKTGKELWKLKGSGDIPVPTPVFSDGLIVLTAAHGPGRPIFAIKTDAEGDISESKKGIAWSQEKAGNYMQTPLLHGGRGYFCFDSGILSAYQLSTGERLYQQRLGGGTSGFTSSPVAAGNSLYITNEEGKTYVVELGDKYKEVAQNEIGETVMATPAISDGVLYIRGAKHLFAVGAK